MSEFLSQLQRATEGSRNLDWAIWEQVELCKGYLYRRTPEGWQTNLHGTALTPVWSDGLPECPHYTTNLQDAVSLALSMGATSVRLEWRIDALAKVMFGFPWDDGVPFYDSGSTPALAASAALVKAHESKAEAA